MRKVISISVFDNPKNAYRPGYYWQHLRHTIWGYLNLFPGWEIVIYHDDSLYNNYYGGVVLNLQDKGLVRLVYMGKEKAICKAMLWRLNPIFEDDVEFVLCRDTDHSPTVREKTMAEMFMSSGKALHCIQDNPSHSVPMMGGLISFNVPKMRKIIKEKSLDELLKVHSWGLDLLGEHGTDQHFMKQKLWPILKNHSCMHSVRREIPTETRLLPPIPLQAEIDGCVPFMGTASCDYEKWYGELGKVGHTVNTQKIKDAETRAFATDCFGHLNLELASRNGRRVVLSCDGSPNYYFYMPIVSLLWQHYMGYCPVIMIVGTLKEWFDHPQKRLVLEESRKLGAEIHFIPEIEGYKSSNVAQNSRLYTSCLPMYHDGMYMILSDMDMLPLNREWFNKQDMGRRIHLYYANAYRHEHYPMCYIGCDIKTWREIMKPACPDDITASIKAQFMEDGLEKETDWMKIWCYDEHMFSRKIKAWEGYPNACQMIDRRGGPPIDRIDRSCWPDTFDITKKVDCHSLRPGHVSPNWEKVRDVLAEVVSEEHMDWVVNYRQSFCAKG